ncbi:hypothetical protein GCM10009764_41440 [Nocardia ninae]|uniref:Uncharacterized protein n=1 Tax=Nocardia ninae NBRC 108245 TaxID=1210091 RepID=A0A511MA86_9NOCA|nr:hypothetical protein NN4_21030 [Nocardia ninae NBRC 108245]
MGNCADGTVQRTLAEGIDMVRLASEPDDVPLKSNAARGYWFVRVTRRWLGKPAAEARLSVLRS